MQAIILAAGMGTRLKELTCGNTKCMVKVNGISLIERALRILDKKSLSKIIIVIGYEGQKLMEYIGTLNVKTPVIYVDNPIYNKTNNIYSLSLAQDYLCREDTLLLESDLIFEESVIDALLDDERPALALVDKFASWMDGTCMELDEEDCIVNFIPGKHLDFLKKENYYKTVNIYKLSKHFSENTYVPFLCAYEKAMGENEYYESVIKLIAMLETKEFRAKRLEGQRWYEIDNVLDLNIAESLFATSEQQMDKISSRQGGLWRYPQLIDFGHSVNLHYPPAKMIDELKSNFEVLMTRHPSGREVHTLLASNNFGIGKEHIILGNGVSELIKGLLGKLEGKTGFINSALAEYIDCVKEDRIDFKPDKANLRYDVVDIISFYEEKEVQNLVLCNPDYMSGNCISQEELFQLITWAKEKRIKIVIDESFVDFSDEVTLLKEDVLCRYDGLYVLKNLSESHGVYGLCLGVLASFDVELVEYLKKTLPIWNINSYGEFYMQIMEKYHKLYLESLDKIKKTRNKFVNGLENITWLQPYPSQTNYIMCEVLGKNAKDVCCALLKCNILINDLTAKMSDGKQYIQMAVRTEEENAYLMDCLKNM